jgi:hypothetical protein
MPHADLRIPCQNAGFRRLKAETERFEPSQDRKAHNGFRDRAEAAAMPHHNWSLRPGGMQGGMKQPLPLQLATRLNGCRGAAALATRLFRSAHRRGAPAALAVGARR